MAFNIELTKRHTCKLNDGSVTNVSIRLQVRCNVITWYFNAGETTQEFRDVLYGLAAKAHKDMPNACDGYYRGSDSLHIKRHHTSDADIGYKHNHYRFEQGDVTPERLKQHLYGIVRYDVNGEYLTIEEADEIVEKYAQNYEYENTPSKYTQESPKQFFLSHAMFRLNEKDKHELSANEHLEVPCKDAKRTIDFGMRSLNGKP